jgi:ribosome-interacting GTPase 1
VGARRASQIGQIETSRKAPSRAIPVPRFSEMYARRRDMVSLCLLASFALRERAERLENGVERVVKETERLERLVVSVEQGPSMPTNVTPEYKKAKAAYQEAREPAERLACLKEMLRTIPKHKGTEHLQADIKTRIKELTEELEAPRKGSARKGPVYNVRPEGAAQVALIGPPNSGKSSLHVRLTGSQAETGPYPHTTQAPLPGMLVFQDIHIQLVDLPPVSDTYMEPWMPNALQQALAALLVVDLGVAGCLESADAIIRRLRQKRVNLVGAWRGRLDENLLIPGTAIPQAGPAEAVAEAGSETFEHQEDLFRILIPTLLVANKSDLGADAEEVEAFQQLLNVRYPAVSVSARTGAGLDSIGRLLFDGLGIVRIYTKIPGKPPDMGRPYTLFAGATVYDAARMVHREMAESLRFARIWGSAKFEGQQVGKDHAVADGDVLELHT